MSSSNSNSNSNISTVEVKSVSCLTQQQQQQEQREFLKHHEQQSEQQQFQSKQFQFQMFQQFLNQYPNPNQEISGMNLQQVHEQKAGKNIESDLLSLIRDLKKTVTLHLKSNANKHSSQYNNHAILPRSLGITY